MQRSIRTIRRSMLMLTAAGAAIAVSACGSHSTSSGAAVTGTGSSSAVSTAGCPSSATATLTGSTLTIGTSSALTGPAAFVATISEAMQAYFDYENSLGGISTAAGKKMLQLKDLDDQYVPSKSLANVQQEAEQDGIKVFAGIVGGANNDAVAPFLKSQCDPQLTPLGGATVNTSDEWESYAFSSYTSQGAAEAQYLLKNLPQDKTVAVLYQDDNVGQGTYEGFKQALGGSGVKVVSAQSYEPNAVDISSQMTTLAATKASVLVDASFSTACTQSFAELATTTWRPLVMVDGSCDNGTIALAPKTAEGNVYGVEALKSVGSPDYANDPDVELYTAWMKKEKLTPGIGTEDGWYAGEVAVHILEGAKQFSPAGIATSALSFAAFTPGLMYPDVAVRGWHVGLPIIENYAIAKFDPSTGAFLAPTTTITTSVK